MKDLQPLKPLNLLIRKPKSLDLIQCLLHPSHYRIGTLLRQAGEAQIEARFTPKSIGVIDRRLNQLVKITLKPRFVGGKKRPCHGSRLP